MRIPALVIPLTMIVSLLLAPGCGDAAGDAETTPARNESTVRQDDAPTGQPATDAAADQFAAVLKAVVDDDGLVRYDLFGPEDAETALAEIVESYATRPLPEDPDQRLALWLNGYNANVLLRVYRAARRPGFTNVLAIEGFFDGETIIVAGTKLTLNDLENTKIRPLGDPRIHAALVCAAVSCPPLRNEPFDAEHLDSQLDDQSRRWVNDESKFGVDDGVLAVSNILDWYAEDFDAKPYGGRIGFVRHFAEENGGIARFLAANPAPEVTYRTYDWSLNRSEKQKAGDDGD